MSSTDILKGSSKIVNKMNVKPGINIEEIEANMVENGRVIKNKDPSKEFDKILSGYAKELGVSLDDNTESKKSKRGEEPVGLSIYGDYDNDDSHNDDDSGDNSGEDNSDEGDADDLLSRYNSKTTDFSKQDSDSEDETPSYPQTSYNTNYISGEIERRTDEQRKQETINSVMKDMEGGSGNIFSIERERLEDSKAIMLEEIDSLRNSLEEDDVDISRVPLVSQRSSYEEIENALKILRLKNDRMRYCSFAEEFLLFGAHGLEELFDGKRTWLGRYRPDLTGWHTQVNTKLRRMRYDTSTLVSGVMHDYNIGPGMRLVLELLPNMFMYSKMRKQQHGTPTIYNEEDIAAHINRIRDSEER